MVYVPDLNDSSAELLIDPGFVSFVLFVVGRTLRHYFATKFTQSTKKRPG